jgi:hypothetical protein
MRNGDLTIVCVGDLSFNGHSDRMLRRHGPDYPFRHLLSSWREADLRIGNLESPVTSRPRATPNKFTLRGCSRAIESLKAAGFDSVCVANNHMMDFGPEGLTEACCRVAATGISVVGAGATLEEACRPAILNVRGQKVGILAFCDVIQDSPLYARDDAAGVARGEIATCVSHVQKLRPRVDWIIVHMHWGTELSQLPSPDQRQWAKALVGAGANAVIGHHPHVVQPIEMIDNAIVAYSLGDFLFSEAFWRGIDENGRAFSNKMRLNPLTRKTGWLELTLIKDGVAKYRFCPAVLSRRLQVMSDNSPKRVRELERLARQLTAEDYPTVFDVEARRAAIRRAVDGQYHTVTRWLELKMFHWRLLPWAVTDQDAHIQNACT